MNDHTHNTWEPGDRQLSWGLAECQDFRCTHRLCQDALEHPWLRVCPPQPGSWWGSQLPEQGMPGLSPLPCPQLQKHLHPARAPSDSSTASPGNPCLPKPAALQLNHPTRAFATFSQGGPPCCGELLPPLLLLALQGPSAGLGFAADGRYPAIFRASLWSGNRAHK